MIPPSLIKSEVIHIWRNVKWYRRLVLGCLIVLSLMAASVAGGCLVVSIISLNRYFDSLSKEQLNPKLEYADGNAYTTNNPVTYEQGIMFSAPSESISVSPMGKMSVRKYDRIHPCYPEGSIGYDIDGCAQFSRQPSGFAVVVDRLPNPLFRSSIEPDDHDILIISFKCSHCPTVSSNR